LSHVCCSSFKICKEGICCVVGMAFIHDTSRFGSPVNFCAQRPESLLIPAAKHPWDVRKIELRVLHINFRQPNIWCTPSWLTQYTPHMGQFSLWFWCIWQKQCCWNH
jgi:hypothetical protein